MPRVCVSRGIDAAIEYKPIARNGSITAAGAARNEEKNSAATAAASVVATAVARARPHRPPAPRAGRRAGGSDPQATTHARRAAGRTITDVSLVAIARPAATPASVDHARPPPIATRPTAITNASVKQANNASWMYMRE